MKVYYQGGKLFAEAESLQDIEKVITLGKAPASAPRTQASADGTRKYDRKPSMYGLRSTVLQAGPPQGSNARWSFLEIKPEKALIV